MSSKEQCKIVELNRLKNFPIMMFTIIMGLSGITIVFQKAHELFGIPSFIGNVLLVIDGVLFLTIGILYILKIVKYTEEVKDEFNHPIRINFFAAISISFLLIAIALEPVSKNLAHCCFFIGVVMQTYFTFKTISFWIDKNLELHHSNPAWFIPIVGNVLVPIAGVGFVDNNFLMYYFSIGMFFWIVLTAIITSRIIFHHQLAGKFTPTLFIFIAPPALAFIAYVKMNTGEFDMFASSLYNLALFFTFLLIFMYKKFINLKFFISWWAFTFPLTAVTIASMLAYKSTQIIAYKYFSYLFMIIAILVILFVITKTIQHMFKGEICIEE